MKNRDINEKYHNHDSETKLAREQQCNKTGERAILRQNGRDSMRNNEIMSQSDMSDISRHIILLYQEIQQQGNHDRQV